MILAQTAHMIQITVAVAVCTILSACATTGAAPPYVKGALYFDTTLNKLMVGGATAWETVTSS